MIRRHIFASVLVLGFVSVTGANERKTDDWPMYGKNLQRTFSNPHSGINPKNVSRLKLKWSFSTSDAVTASPTVVDGVVYVGAWDGFFYALKARTGQVKWKFKVDCQNSVAPVPPHCLAPGETPPDRLFTDGGLITSSAAVIDDKVYFGAGRTLYSLNTEDGSLRWKRLICGNPDDQNCASDSRDPTRIFSSPAVFNGLVFGGHSNSGVVGYRGGFEAIDAKTGEIRWRFEVDPILDANGQVAGGLNRGCGNVWSSAAVDKRHGLVFFGTADCQFDAPPPYHEAVIALKAMTGEVRWVFRPRETDRCDFDFGATPNLIAHGKERHVGVGGKDGTYYLLNSLTNDPKGERVWETNVVFGGNAGGFFGGAAFDGKHIYSATGLGDFNPLGTVCEPDNPFDTPIQEPSIHAFDAVTGQVIWQQTQNQSFAPTTLADDVIFVGFTFPELPPALIARDARTCEQLWRYDTPGAVNAGATPVGKMVFVGTGNSFDGQGGGVQAFGLP